MRIKYGSFLLAAWMFVCASCALFKSRPHPYPSGLIFPVIKEASLSFQGEPISPLRERGAFIFFSTRDGFVWCVDGLQRKTIWKTRIENGLGTAPCLGKENIYVKDNQDVVYGLNAQGQILWKKVLGERLLTPIVEDRNRIFFGTDKGRLWSLDLNGEDSTFFQAGGAVGAGPLIIGAEIVFGADDGKIYFLGLDGTMRGFFQASGKILNPLGGRGRILFFNTENRQFYGLSVSRRKPRWKLRLAGNLAAEPVVQGRRLYLLGTNSVLYCLKATSGDVLWWQNIPARQVYDLMVIEDKVVVAMLSPSLQAFDAKKGQKVGEYKAERDLDTNSLWADPYLVIASHDFQTDIGELLYLKKEVTVSLSPQKSSPQPPGEEILFSASADGFFKPKYEFFLRAADKREIVQKESESSSWTWYAEKEGSYFVGVRVVDEKESKETEIPFVIAKPVVNPPVNDSGKETVK